MFQILWILLIGLVLGILAKLILPGRQAIPWWLTMLLGAAAALLGNAAAGWIGVRHTGGVDWIRHLLQVGFAVVVVALAAPLWHRSRARR
ncbi:GlsB/YeaQ/YmgE family stress response membrane protein [Streptomyces kaniharaensis]|uniref:GlsB/YeaQ/YmgE family stress response membrane protein n=1 Tax=Streptomyces kaniharaensis TaxID=212423 RepID=A0A6N7KYE7_9ACTN|nr:GlsB/YeaQ/YmgE family stress response membrane protein [Streptomyces kaniharaensis]MQS16652.1 GlsB/YeaQ/YmgE family stress response membrane protein [Streptomyces kaniharaensis]